MTAWQGSAGSVPTSPAHWTTSSTASASTGWSAPSSAWSSRRSTTASSSAWAFRWPLSWRIPSCLTNYIPNIGFVLGIIPPALLALVDSGWKSAVIVTVGYSIVNFVIQSIIQPRVTGDAVGLTPTMSFLSLLLWGWVFGGLGALIAPPMSLLVKALLTPTRPRAGQTT